jgi:ferredoxin
MPYGLQTLGRIAEVTGYDEAKLEKALKQLCSKGLVIDLLVEGRYYYSISPLVIGFYEFTMMRRGKGINHRELSRLFSRYLLGEDGPMVKNYGNGQQLARMRAMPHEGVIEPSDYVEVLDYEKATAIIEENDKFSIGYCACRHEKLHLGEKQCDVPLDSCTSFGRAADYLVRNDMAREADRSEMLDNLARSRDFGLVLLADNTRTNATFICNCCSCCCNALASMRKFDYSHLVVPSTLKPVFEDETCKGCGSCAKACPVNAIEMVSLGNPDPEKKKRPRVDESACLGCGVCALKCKTGSIQLVKSDRRVIHPETTFERVILQSLERGTLQYQLFDNPNSRTHRFLQVFFGAFLNLPPTKRLILSDTFRSSFLGLMAKGVEKKGKGFLLEM